MSLRTIAWTVGGILFGVPLALFLANWLGDARLHQHMPRALFTVTVQTGYVTFLLSPVVLSVALIVWLARRVWCAVRGSRGPARR